MIKIKELLDKKEEVALKYALLGLDLYSATARFGHAAHRFTASGFAATPPEILAEREKTCRACPEWDAAALRATGRCRKCGCSTWAKLRMATEACPLGKWKAIHLQISQIPQIPEK